MTRHLIALCIAVVSLATLGTSALHAASPTPVTGLEGAAGVGQFAGRAEHHPRGDPWTGRARRQERIIGDNRSPADEDSIDPAAQLVNPPATFVMLPVG